MQHRSNKRQLKTAVRLPLAVLSWLLCLFYMVTVYWLSSLSLVPVPSFFLVHDFLSHALLYAGLSGLLSLALLNSGARKNFGFYALLIAIMYSFTDEGHQAFVPQRDPSAADLLADAVGAAVGVYVFYGLRRLTGQESSEFF